MNLFSWDQVKIDLFLTISLIFNRFFLIMVVGVAKKHKRWENEEGLFDKVDCEQSCNRYGRNSKNIEQKIQD